MNKNKNSDLFANKRKRLRAEMDAAEALLKENIAGLDVFDYILPATSKIMPSVGQALKQEPANLMVPLVMLTNQFLPEKHWIRRLISFINSMVFMFK